MYVLIHLSQAHLTAPDYNERDELIQRLRLVVMGTFQMPPSPYRFSSTHLLDKGHLTMHYDPRTSTVRIDLFYDDPLFNPAEVLHDVQQVFRTDHIRYQILHGL
jgi:hypothetical protein